MSQTRVQSRAPRLGPRIVDEVFGSARPERPRGMLFALSLASAVHGLLWLWAVGSERTLESWSAQVAARVHVELGRETLVETTPPVPEPQKPDPAEPPPTSPKTRAANRLQTRAAPPPPAQAGSLVAQDTNAPEDLTGAVFVTGTASAYAGGVTAARGTSQVAVPARNVEPSAARPLKAREPDRSQAVTLEEQEWSCAWPRAADAEQIDEQTVVLRVMVRPDGSAESATAISDPGNGFGQAATGCALRTRFTPARDAHGHRVRAQSPPIRVRFSR